MKKRGIYTIARIGVFKDNPLAHAKPDLAVKTTGGAVWLDNENLAWVDPAKKEVWDCNIAVAEETALPGFDEIQFDCARFQDAAGTGTDQRCRTVRLRRLDALEPTDHLFLE